MTYETKCEYCDSVNNTINNEKCNGPKITQYKINDVGIKAGLAYLGMNVDPIESSYNDFNDLEVYVYGKGPCGRKVVLKRVLVSLEVIE